MSDAFESKAWPAPAKINLFLHITGRREDGYHELQTVFQFIDLADEIDFIIHENNPSIKRSSELAGVNEADDLVVRAARALQEYSACTKGATIHVHKRIPTGGGVGGGSSDAATVLVALNKLWQTNLTVDELADLGVVLGADVPVFVRGTAAWAEGVGEKLEPVEPTEHTYVLIHPGVGIPTKEIFCDSDLTRNTPAITIRDFLAGAETRNDCEKVAKRLYPEVKQAMEWLDEYVPAKLTGTGACIFGAFADAEKVKAVAEKVPSMWQAYCVKGMNHSPLLERLNAEQG